MVVEAGIGEAGGGHTRARLFRPCALVVSTGAYG